MSILSAAFALALAGAHASAAGAPAVANATWSLPFDDTPRTIALSGPASVEPRTLDGTVLRVEVTYGRPLDAVRRVEAIGGTLSSYALDAAEGVLIAEIETSAQNGPVGLRVIDAVSAGTITPWDEIVIAQHTAEMNGDGRFDLTDVVAFVTGIGAGDPVSDIVHDGVLDQSDITAFIQAFLDAVPRSEALPAAGPVPTLFVPAGGTSREIEIPFRAWGVGEIAADAASRDQGLLEDGGISLVVKGERLVLAASSPAGAAGATTVDVTIEQGGATLDLSVPVTVAADAPPIARFTAEPFLGAAPLPVAFDASRSSDVLENIASYAWSFGDGATASGANASHTFTAPGEYTVTLTLTDDSGNTDTLTRVVTVAPDGFDRDALPIDAWEAKRFLWQAAFGPAAEDVGFVMANGFEAWIDQQMALPPTLFDYDAIDQARDAGLVSGTAPHRFFDDIAVFAPDQLRQRVAWALIQIVVMNWEQNGNSNEADMLYYNRYLNESFGSYADLLEWVTLSYQMGVYLTYSNSSAEDPDTGSVPDENYARELMQLFSIGLEELGPDGTPIRDPFGDPIPAYTLDDVVQFSRAFTGLRRTDRDDRLPMSPRLNRRELGAKQLLDYPGAVPAGGYLPENFGATEADVLDEVALTVANVFHHPNTPPFLAELLIKRFVTSNPTRAYVGRVADAFRGGGPFGTGVRGDLGATVKAILLDPEARDPAYRTNPAYGKVMEPLVTAYGLLRVTGLIDNPDNPPFIDRLAVNTFRNPDDYRQGFMRSPSVFNFYLPDFTVPDSALERGGLVAPELQIHTSYTSFSAPNRWLSVAFSEGGSSSYMDPLAEAAGYDPATIVAMLEADFLHAPVSDASRAIIVDAVDQVNSNRNGVRAAVRLLLATPEFTVIK